MTFKRAKARIGERSITSGSGPWSLAGAFDFSYNAFSSFLSDGDSTEISVVEPGAAAWTGIGTYTASGNSMAPTTVEETFGTFGAGTKEIFAGSLASRHLVKEDMAGAIVTSGTSTAYTVSSFRVYDTLTRLHGNAIAFTPHTTNGQTVTLNVDGLGAKPLRLSPGIELQSNTLIEGTPYTALYNHTDDAFYLHALSAGNTYGVPLGAGMDFWGTTTPSSAFIFPAGQALDRTIFAELFALIGTTYGSGNGSTTFNVFDKTGRISAMKEASASRLTSTYFGGNSTVLGAVGGSENHTLSTVEMPSHSHANSLTDPGHTHTINQQNGPGNNVLPTASSTTAQPPATTNSNTTGITITNANAGSGNAHPIVQPTIICNYIMRAI